MGRLVGGLDQHARPDAFTGRLVVRQSESGVRSARNWVDRAVTRDRSAEKGRVADLSLAMLNQVLEATLAFMVLLLAMSVTAIIRLGPTTNSAVRAGVDGDAPPSTSGLTTAAPAPELWRVPGTDRLTSSGPAVRKTGWLGRGRYEARHVRGRMPRQWSPGPAGPPWGPAAPPPGRPQPGSERWI